MSHTVKINVKFKTTEFKQLTKAFSQLGWTINQNAHARQYSGTSPVYQHVAVNPEKGSRGYDIGITPLPTGELDLKSDFYGGSIEKSLGKDLNKLRQEFAVALVEDEWPNATITRSADSAGNLLLEVEQW